MPLLESLVVAAALLAPMPHAAPVAAESVTFEYIQPGAGAVQEQRHNMDINMHIVVTQGEVTVDEADQAFTKEEHSVHTVLAADGTRITHKTVAYKRIREAENGIPLLHAVEGHTYTITATEDGPIFERADGQALSADETEFLTGEYENFGDDDQFATLLGGRTFEVGEEFVVPKEVAQNVFGDDEALRIERFALILRGEKTVGDQKCAVFDAEITMLPPAAPGMTIQFDLKGPMVFTLGCWPVEMDLTGPVTLSGADPQAGMEINGTGTMTMKSQATYR